MQVSPTSWARPRPFALACTLAFGLAACGGGDNAGIEASSLESRAIVELASAAPLPGAIWTSLSGCASVNANLYELKTDVYLDGGPAREGAAGLLPNTSYYVQVTTPSGALLGTSGSNRPVSTDAVGQFAACYRLWDVVQQSGGGAGFADTTNSGGEYKVWISTSAVFDNAATKTDNFKVRATLPPPPVTAEVTIRKWYDANTNGVWDAGEPEMAAPANGWKVDLTGFAPKLTVAVYTGVPREDVVAREYRPDQANWVATNAYLDATPVTNAVSANLVVLNQILVPLSSAASATVNFGDVCTGAGGAHTLGYWSNKNGQAKFQTVPGVLGELAALNLRNEDGSAFDPANYASFRSWLLSGRAVNMAYMLSVQLAAMKLNVLSGDVPGTAMVLAVGAAGANPAGFISVNALVAEANESLGLYATTRAGMEPRGYQELLKNALDAANNNTSFAQAAPCAALTFTPPVVP